MNDSLLTGNAPDEEEVRFFRVHSELAQGIVRFGRAIFLEIDAVIDHMTGAHVEAIQMLFPNAADKTFLLREFEEPGATCWRDVPDPIGLGRDVYNTCAETIKNALPSVLAFVEESEVAVRPGGRSGGASIYIVSDILHSTPSNLNAPSGGLRKVDPEIFDAVTAEEKRQRENIELIASENFTSRAVMEAQGSVLTNKYAEGYPAKRWYGGCENVDTVESLAIERAKRLFGAEHVNVQPHSGAQANMVRRGGWLCSSERRFRPEILARQEELVCPNRAGRFGPAIPRRAAPPQ